MFSSQVWHVVSKHMIKIRAIANVAKKCAKNRQGSEWNSKGSTGHSYGGNCIKPLQWKQQMCTKIILFDSARVCSWAQKAFEWQVSSVFLPFVFQENSSTCFPVTPLENFTSVVHKLLMFLPVSGLVLHCCMNIHWKSGLTRLLFNTFLKVQLQIKRIISVEELFPVHNRHNVPIKSYSEHLK